MGRIEAKPWREAFAESLAELREPSRCDAGCAVLRSELTRLATHPFILAQWGRVARTGDASGVADLKAGRVRLEPGRSVDVDATWSLAHVADDIDRWRIQLWIFVRDAVYDADRREFSAARPALELARAWADRYVDLPSPASVSDFAWHDHATALRAEYLLWLALVLRDSPIRDQEYLPLLYRLIEHHCVVLGSEDFYSVGTNHGFDQAYALYLLCAAFPLGQRQSALKELAFERLTREVAVAFTSEGVHIENSPSYHVNLTGRLFKVEAALKAFDPERAVSLSSTIDRAGWFIAHALRPDGTLPLLGDTETSARLLATDEFSGMSCQPALQFTSSRGKLGAAPETTTALFSSAGYAFLRDHWRDNSALHLTFKCGFLSQYHRHDDDNTVLLFGFGEDWLTGAGIYQYDEKNPIRRYLRSSQGHNVMSVDGLEADRQNIGHTALALVSSDAIVTVLEGSSRGYPGFTYRRRVAFDRSRALIRLTDRLEPVAEQSYACSLRFHIPVDKKLEILPDGAIEVTSLKTGRVMRIRVEGERLPVEIACGRVEPPLGWTSPRRGVLHPAYAVLFRAQVSGLTEISTQVEFPSR